jgi:FkbM family methyltransferase
MAMGAAAVTASAMHLLHQGVCVPDYEKLLEGGYSRLIEPAHVVFDVGAHTGRHLDRFVQLVGSQGRVFGFEALPGLAQQLKRRYQTNPCVTIRAVALSNRSGEATFRMVENGPGVSGLKRREPGPGGLVLRLPANRIVGGLMRRILQHHPFGRFSNLGQVLMRKGWMIVRDFPVKLDTIDAQAALLERLDFIKLDVEGGEMDCLRGAEATVARHRPFISIEYGHTSYSLYGETILSLFNWARERRYLLSDLFGNIIEDEAEWLEVCDVSYWDYFILPEERRDVWQSRFSS